jgi:uroporphyrin-III C-methyltransferase
MLIVFFQVFGRGGEEMDFLQQQGIRVEVIPGIVSLWWQLRLFALLVVKQLQIAYTRTFAGITSASGIAAELGIPLTHRGVATSVRFLTGHSRNGGTDPLFVAENAADPDTTLVVYMGLSTLPSLAPKLMKHGLPPNTPAVAVERGTTPQQRTVFATLKDLVDEVHSADLVSPTLIIIGKVVALSPFWVESSEQDALTNENSYKTEAKR